MFKDQGLDQVTDDPKVLTLKGRLLKDLADRADGDERARLYREASDVYLAAYRLKADTYPLINAATLALLASDTAQSHSLAQQALDLIEADPNEGETPYWREATRAEGLLLLDQRRKAQEALSAGIALLPEAWEDHAATIAQFERIAAARNESADWLDAYRPPCSVHFSGLIGLNPDDPTLHAAIDSAIAELKPGFAFGALAAGADIMLAEALVASGTQLHLTLPWAVDEFRKQSVEPSGGEWPERFDRLLEKAETVRICEPTQLTSDNPRSAFNDASLVAMGQTFRQAEVLRSVPLALTISAQGEAERLPIRAWRNSGLNVLQIETQRVPSQHSHGALAKGVEGQLPTSALVVSGDNSVAELKIEQALERISKLSGDAAIGLSVGGREIAAQLARVPVQGMTACDWSTAMIAKVLCPTVRIEELGELSLPTGPVGLWSIAY